MDYFELQGDVVNPDESFMLPHAEEIFYAINQRREWEFYERRAVCRDETDEVIKEIIVAEVTCDGVPSKESAGIEYRERIAFEMVVEPETVPTALALRKSFPLVMHLNATPENKPKSLCLYFEPKLSVLRTWTAQKHLQRVVWWLENTANGTLHPVEQPVEQLFFESPVEIVLPDKYLIESIDAADRLRIIQLEQRDDPQGLTVIVDWPNPQYSHKEIDAGLITINCSTIEHGRIENTPQSYKSLATLLESRGTDLHFKFKQQIDELVEENGVAPISKYFPTIILVCSPIARDSEGVGEMTQFTAYLSEHNFLELGEKCDFINYVDGKYYRTPLANHINSINDAEDFCLVPMHVLFSPSAERRRQQSGIGHSGPKGVLIGAGALGGALLDLWNRAGWGEWTVVDNDHIRPHNLTRHHSLLPYMGVNKARASKYLSACQTKEPVVRKAFGVNAININAPKMKEAFEECEIVIDASTTLEYPRRTSIENDLPRHMSLFLAPGGIDAVLLFEDENRNIRLGSIEAQYYRAIISNEWGNNHLTGNQNSYWSGGSCRDISTVIPYSRVTSYAALLFEQVCKIHDQAEALACVWRDDLDIGKRVAYPISLSNNQAFKLDKYNVNIDNLLVTKLLQMRENNLPNETGGILVGYHDFNIGEVFIVDVLPAPPDSQSSQTGFQRGIEGLEDRLLQIDELTAGHVGYIGEWHSHPVNSRSLPSVKDICQLCYLAEKMQLDGLPAYSLIVGEDGVSIYIAS